MPENGFCCTFHGTGSKVPESAPKMGFAALLQKCPKVRKVLKNKNLNNDNGE